MKILFCDLCGKKITDKSSLDYENLFVSGRAEPLLECFSEQEGDFPVVHKKCYRILKKDKKFYNKMEDKLISSWEVNEAEKYLLSSKQIEKIKREIIKEIKLKYFVK